MYVNLYVIIFLYINLVTALTITTGIPIWRYDVRYRPLAISLSTLDTILIVNVNDGEIHGSGDRTIYGADALATLRSASNR